MLATDGVLPLQQVLESEATLGEGREDLSLMAPVHRGLAPLASIDVRIRVLLAVAQAGDFLPHLVVDHKFMTLAALEVLFSLPCVVVTLNLLLRNLEDPSVSLLHHVLRGAAIGNEDRGPYFKSVRGVVSTLHASQKWPEPWCSQYTMRSCSSGSSLRSILAMKSRATWVRFAVATPEVRSPTGWIFPVSMSPSRMLTSAWSLPPISRMRMRSISSSSCFCAAASHSRVLFSPGLAGSWTSLRQCTTAIVARMASMKIPVRADDIERAREAPPC